MKVFILIYGLLSFSVKAQNPATTEVEGEAVTRHNSPQLIEVAKMLACAAGCKYEPENIPQAAVCMAATILGDKVSQLLRCGSNHNIRGCQEEMDTEDGNVACVWTPHPDAWTATLHTHHFCLPKIVADSKNSFFGRLSAFKPLFESLYAITPANDPVTDPPKYPIVKLMDCLTHSSGSCPSGCKPCVIADAALLYPAKTGNPIEKLCLPDKIEKEACPLINTPKATRTFCPFKNPRGQIDELCEKAGCPDSITCPAAAP